MTEMENRLEQQAAEHPAPDKGEYIRKIMELPDVDRAFIEGYLFAMVTSGKRKSA